MHRNGVNVCRMIGLAALAAVLVLATGSRTAWAQNSYYSLSYFSNANTPGAPDATLRLVNNGIEGDSSPSGDMCAAIYVFTPDEQLNECCACKITPNGLLTLSVNTNLTKNPLTGIKATRGAIKILSVFPISHTTCDPVNFPDENPALLGWLTHIQKTGAGPSTSWLQTEEELMDSKVGLPELFDLEEDCKVLIELGSGHGTCDCTDAGR